MNRFIEKLIILDLMGESTYLPDRIMKSVLAVLISENNTKESDVK